MLSYSHIICYRWYVMGLYPPRLQFSVNVLVEKLSFHKGDGQAVWNEVARLTVGPENRVVTSKQYQVCLQILHVSITD